MRRILAPLAPLALVALLLVFCAPLAEAARNDSETFILAGYGTLRTLDPCVAYDTVSQQRILNLYDTLVFFDGEATERFVPRLAVEVPSIENGTISRDGRTYTFTIRKGVRFHQGGEVTPEDVAYSFKRNMIADPDGGPMWMLLEALTGEGSTRDAEGNVLPGIFEKIDKAVTVKDQTVVFRLPIPYPPFLSILCYSSSVVLDQDWATAIGCWDGKPGSAARFNNPAPGQEPLRKIENGTGPYAMQSWEPGKEFVFARFADYYRGEPAIETAVYTYVNDWASRKAMLQNGEADRVIVDNPYVPEVEQMEGLRVYKVPQLSVTGALFCQQVNPETNPNIGSGRLDGEGIPPDFFADKDVRLAFQHAFDRQRYKTDVFNNLVIMPTSPNVIGLPYHKDVPVYPFDLERATEHMRKAFGGKVWEKGFKMVITHNTGNEMREAAARMLAENVMSLNPKFRIEVRSVDWKDYLVHYRDFHYPIFLIGWNADYADPHNFIHPFMHSRGVYGKYMAYQNPEVDKLCDEGIATVAPAERERIYHRLQDLWYEEAAGIMLYQQIVVRAYRSEVKGFTPNPMFNDEWEDLFELTKQ